MGARRQAEIRLLRMLSLMNASPLKSCGYSIGSRHVCEATSSPECLAQIERHMGRLDACLKQSVMPPPNLKGRKKTQSIPYPARIALDQSARKTMCWFEKQNI